MNEDKKRILIGIIELCILFLLFIIGGICLILFTSIIIVVPIVMFLFSFVTFIECLRHLSYLYYFTTNTETIIIQQPQYVVRIY